jgi:hypothetical protein
LAFTRSTFEKAEKTEKTETKENRRLPPTISELSGEKRKKGKKMETQYTLSLTDFINGRNEPVRQHWITKR